MAMRLPLMHKSIATAAVLVLMVSAATPALPGVCSSDPRLCRPPDRDLFDPRSTEFDLGIDVSDVGLDRGDVLQFVGSLPLYAQRTMVVACQHQLRNRVQARSRQTLQFCDMLLNG
jgi:hypothetical protein